MMGRCYLPDHDNYHSYGGRGITVCARWRNSSRAFCEDMHPSFKKGLTLDRRDVNGDYTPDNCRWATLSQQANNRRDNALITYKGETLSATEWSRRLNLSLAAITYRRQQGLSVAKVLSPVVKPKTITHQGKTQLVSEWAAELGVPDRRIHARLKMGWSGTKALLTPVHPTIGKVGVITFKGLSLTVKDWAARTGICSSSIASRLRCGWSVERTLTTPVDQTISSPVKLSYQGEALTIMQWAKRLKISHSTIRNRLSKGWSVEKTLATPVRGVRKTK